MQNVRVLIVDDHAPLRQVLVQTLTLEPGIEIVGQAENGRQAAEMAAELVPDVILMDVIMPEMNGIEATRQIARQEPGIGIIGFSVHCSDFYARTMLEAGARAYLLKDGDIDELVEAIRTVCEGGTYLSAEFRRLARTHAKMTSCR